MDINIDRHYPESPAGEGSARPKLTTIAALKERLNSFESTVLSRLVETFGIPESGIGTLALLSELKSDWTSLSKILDVPEWVNAFDRLRVSITPLCSVDAVRDLAAIRSQPKSPLRRFLGPISKSLSADQQRAVRSVRGLVALKLQSAREQATLALTEEVRRWLDGQGPADLSLNDINPHSLRKMHSSFVVDSETAKLLICTISALESNLEDPFTPSTPSSIVGPSTKSTSQLESKGLDDPDVASSKNEAGEFDEEKAPDPLRGFLAEAGNAGIRIFSGIPLYLGLLPLELELIIPRIVQRLSSIDAEEALAALMTLFSRVLPSNFSRIPLSSTGGAGLWLDLKSGVLCWNLDEVIASDSGRPFLRSADDRYVYVALPLELVVELRRRAEAADHPQSVADLFQLSAKHLAKRTKAMLWNLKLSSHRPTLTHLSNSWGPFLLSRFGDEAYAAAAGIKFTIGTSANFNYVRLRGSRLSWLVASAYRQVGLSGNLPVQTIPDVGSLWLPDEARVASFIETTFRNVDHLVRALPKHITKKRLMDVHNQVAVGIYSVLKPMLAGRELSEETIARSRVDPSSGAVIITDKRTARYHERRLVCLPLILRRWLATYLNWLKLVAYRLAGEDRTLAHAIASVADRSLDGDRHPLFFRFTKDGRTVALGSADLTIAYARYGFKENFGRHFLDYLLREAGSDSADVMGIMGRANPGQETCGGSSAVVPLEFALGCADKIERWLGTLSLPMPPEIEPRKLKASAIPLTLPKYVPRLLKTPPEWNLRGSLGPRESCPFDDDTVLLASYFPDLFSAWRSRPVPDGWARLALSLIFEDGIALDGELKATLAEISDGTIYRERRVHFVDGKSGTLGIRRVRLSEITVRLIYRLKPGVDRVSVPRSDDIEIEHFLAGAVPEATGKGIAFIMASAAAYRSLRMPGALNYWVRGLRFARTSRPETVARHMLGVCEYPKFDARRRTRRSRTVKTLRSAVNKAIRKVKGGSSHATAISWLLKYLEAAEPTFEQLSHQRLAVGYEIHLCKGLKNIHTLSRYEFGSREFLEKAAVALSGASLDEVDWQSIVASCITGDDSSLLDSPVRTSINHALGWLGLDVRASRRTGPPPCAFVYAEMASAREGALAISLLKARQLTVGDDWHCAATALKLLLEHPHRWDAIACLRLCDFALTVAHPHFVITKESGADLKSDNAPCVYPITDAELVVELKAICDKRAARFPGDSLVPLFGDDLGARSHDTSDRIHDMIANALWCVTGSPLITIHDTRDTTISHGIERLLNAEERYGAGRTLRLRQGMFHLMAEASHSSPTVTAENYGHNFDVHRRIWVNKINDDASCTPSSAFLASVTGIPAVTYRKRASRHVSASPDFFENFDPAVPLGTRAKVVELSSLVSSELDHIEVDDVTDKRDVPSGMAIYFGLRLLGESENASRLTSRLTEADAGRLELGIAALQRRRPSRLGARPDISRKTFVDSIVSTGLAIAMNATPPTMLAVNHLAASIDLIGDSWTFVNREDVLEFYRWITVWRSNDITVEVVMRRNGSSAIDDHLLQRIKSIGAKKVRFIKDRHFNRGVQAMLRFVPAKSAVSMVSARASPSISFLVTACALSLLINPKGILHEDTETPEK
ncbi:MAG: hypothetical protein NT159_19480 [Proteobacteria bacterium]|nr:hypothetical protein [Pseudomonadota bacterium]